MARIDAAAHVESLQPARRRDRDWVLALAFGLGAIVCVPSMQALDVGGLLSALPMEWFGRYSDTAMALVAAMITAALLLPFSLVVLED